MQKAIIRAFFYDHGDERIIFYNDENLKLCQSVCNDAGDWYIYKNDEIYHGILDLETKEWMFMMGRLKFSLLVKIEDITCFYNYFRLHITPIDKVMISCELNDGAVKNIPFSFLSKFTKYKSHIKLNITSNEFTVIEKHKLDFALTSMICVDGTVKYLFASKEKYIFEHLFNVLEVKYKVEDELYSDQVIYTVPYTKNDITIFFNNFPISAPLYIDECKFYYQCKNATNILQNSGNIVYVDIDAPEEELETLFYPKIDCIENYNRRGITNSFRVQSYDKIMELCEYFGINAS